MADIYSELLEKATFFRNISKKIFESHAAFKFIDSDSIFKGFFLLFVYKDLFLRDIIFRIKECLPSEKGIRVLDQIE